MMHIEKHEQGWTVVDDAGQVRLHTKEGEPMFLATEDEAVGQCNANGMYRAKADNPGGYPEGTLLELSFGNSESNNQRPRG